MTHQGQSPVVVREVGLRDGLDVPTGLDFDALLALRGRVAGWLDGEPLHGNIRRAGLPKTMKEAA